MPRKAKSIFVAVPSHLSKVMADLNRKPKPALPGVTSLRLTMAARNDHFGARHFVKEDLPRVRFANPALDIQIQKVPKTKEDTWRPEMVLEFRDGSKRTLNLQGKWSTAIFQELMDVAGGTPWIKWKESHSGAETAGAQSGTAESEVEIHASTETRTGVSAALP